MEAAWRRQSGTEPPPRYSPAGPGNPSAKPRISNIQTSWVKLGVERTQVMLNGGANDLGGSLMEETISRMAVSENGSAKSVAELVAIANGINRPARQRSTDYTPLAA